MITLILGGTRSGKSDVAESLAARSARDVVYVATAAHEPDDRGFTARVEAHRQRRPPMWHTLEVDHDLAGSLLELRDDQTDPATVLIDSIGTWLARHDDFVVDVGALTEALEALDHDGHDVIVVAEEVGMGVHATTDVGRRFADALGIVNQQLAGIADATWLVVAGRLLALHHLDEVPADSP